VLRLPALIGCVFAVALAVGGCGGGTAHRQTATGPSRGQPPTVTFTGGRLPSTVYVGAGPDELSLDVYRVSGSLGQARRITFSPLGLGIQSLAADRSEAVIERICCGLLHFVDTLNFARRGGLPGTMIGAGMDPAIAPDGRFARVVPGYQGCNCDALLVRSSLLGADHLQYTITHPGTIAAVAASPTGQLGVAIGTRRSDGALAHPAILLDPGTSNQRRIDPGPKWLLPSGFWFGPDGQLSWQLESGALVIRSPTGRLSSVPVLGSWQVSCWFPNGTLLALSPANHDAIGTLDPRTGTVTTVGRANASAAVFTFDCPLPARVSSSG
jgi:hypothetical protein